MISKNDICKLALEIRISSLKLTSITSASHIGSCFSVADLLAAILIKCQITGSELFFSKGHAAAALYSGLSELGKFDKSFLDTFGENGSEMIGHVNHKVPGVIFSTGSLGHGLPVAAGYAHGNPDKIVYVILSDGELNEGTTWETLALSKHLKISNLKIIIDLNGIQSFGTTKQVLNLDPLTDKFKSFGWKVKEINGHDYSELLSVFYERSFDTFEILIAKTIKGKGIKSMENKLLWHYKSWPKDMLSEAILELRNHA